MFKKELQTVREQGYSISDNENDTRTYAIGAPIQSYSGETIASINLVGPISYMKGLHRSYIIKTVMNTAKENIDEKPGEIPVNKYQRKYSKKSEIL